MKKIMLLFLLANISTVKADMKIDVKTETIYSIPKTRDINQAEYHKLALVVVDEISKMKSQGYSETQIDKFLDLMLDKLIGTPTAIRLLEDLKKLKACIKK